MGVTGSKPETLGHTVSKLGDEWHGYIVESVVAETNISLICQSTDQETGQKVILKFIKPYGTSGKYMQNELSVTENYSHPHIMNCIQHIQDYEGINCMVYPKCQATLANYLQKRISEKLLKQIAKQVFEALEFLHSNRIWHRDIKPENILIKNFDKGEPYILLNDFGLTKLPFDKEAKKEYVGTPVYMAPELHLFKDYNEKIDIWAFGVTMFLLLAGRYPFRGTSIDMMKHDICAGVIVFIQEDWQHISPNAIDLIQQTLKKDPKKRISAHDALKHPWFNDINKKCTHSQSCVSLNTFRKKTTYDDDSSA